MMKNAIFACLLVLFGLVMASDTAIETQLRVLQANEEPVEADTPPPENTENDDPPTQDIQQKDEDVAIPWDAWVSWGIGGFLMLFIIGSIIWKVAPRICK